MLTNKQEAFCLAYVETNNASEAYRRSYNAKNMKPSTVNRSAFEVLENPNVAARIKELRADHAERHEITIDSLIQKLDVAYRVAINAEQTGAAVSAVMGQAKLLGLDDNKYQRIKAGSKQIKRLINKKNKGDITPLKAAQILEADGIDVPKTMMLEVEKELKTVVSDNADNNVDDSTGFENLTDEELYQLQSLLNKGDKS